MSYIILKFCHILNSTILFGTGLGTAFTQWRANQKQSLEAMYFAASIVVLADFVFTTPAVIIQPITGYLLMQKLGLSFSVPWIKWSLILYGIAACAWLPVVYIQIRLRNLLKDALENSKPLPKQYKVFFSLWFSLGWPGFMSVMLIFYLMVTKTLPW